MWQWELSVSKTHISISTRNEWICRNQYNWEKKTQCSRFYLRAKNFFIAHCYWKHWYYILLFCLIMWLNIVLKRTYVGSVAVNEILLHNLSGNYLKSDWRVICQVEGTNQQGFENKQVAAAGHLITCHQLLWPKYLPLAYNKLFIVTYFCQLWHLLQNILKPLNLMGQIFC